MCVGVVQVLLLELEDADALLAVGFCFCGAVGIDAAFGKEVGAATSDDEGSPAVTVFISMLYADLDVLWRRVGGCADVTY